MESDMQRRDFIKFIAGSAVFGPFSARAKPSKLPVIGYLDGSNILSWFEAFKRGMNDSGYVQGRDIGFEFRSAAGQAPRLPDLAKELVLSDPKVIVASASSAALAARNAPTTVPLCVLYST